MMIMKVRGSWVVNNDLVYIGCNHPRTHGARNQKFPKSAFTRLAPCLPAVLARTRPDLCVLRDPVGRISYLAAPTWHHHHHLGIRKQKVQILGFHFELCSLSHPEWVLSLAWSMWHQVSAGDSCIRTLQLPSTSCHHLITTKQTRFPLLP